MHTHKKRTFYCINIISKKTTTRSIHSRMRWLTKCPLEWRMPSWIESAWSWAWKTYFKEDCCLKGVNSRMQGKDLSRVTWARLPSTAEELWLSSLEERQSSPSSRMVVVVLEEVPIFTSLWASSSGFQYRFFSFQHQVFGLPAQAL